MSETILMIHGGWCTSEVWSAYREFFERLGYNVITPTQRYHVADAPPHPELGNTSLEVYVNDLIALVDSLDSPPIVFGHSMGGMIAQLLATKRPIKKLVLIASVHCAGYKGVYYSVVRFFLPIMLAGRFWKNPMKPSFNNAVYGLFNALPKSQHSTFYKQLSYESGLAGVQICFWFLNKGQTTLVNAQDINCPTLVVSGLKDRFTAQPIGRFLSQTFNATLYEYPEHAHWIIAEPAWEKVAADIEGWLHLDN